MNKKEKDFFSGKLIQTLCPGMNLRLSVILTNEHRNERSEIFLFFFFGKIWTYFLSVLSTKAEMDKEEKVPRKH